MCTEADPSPPPAHPPPPPWDGGGRHHRRLLYPPADLCHDQCMGHWKGPKLLGGLGNIQACPVPETGHDRLQGEQLCVHSVRVGSEVLSRDARWRYVLELVRARAGGGSSPPMLQLRRPRWCCHLRQCHLRWVGRRRHRLALPKPKQPRELCEEQPPSRTYCAQWWWLQDPKVAMAAVGHGWGMVGAVGSFGEEKSFL